MTGKKTLVMFTMFNCGTNEDIIGIFDFTLRTFPDFMAIDTGVGGQDDEGAVDSAEWTRRKSHKRKSEAVQCFDRLNAGLGRIADAMERSETPQVATGGDARVAELEVRVKFVEALAQVPRAEIGITDPKIIEAYEKEKERILSLMK